MREETIEVLKRLYLQGRAMANVPAIAATLLFDNAKTALTPDGGYTRRDFETAIQDRLKAIEAQQAMERPRAPVDEEEAKKKVTDPGAVNVALNRMAADLQRFCDDHLPLLGVSRIGGPTKNGRTDSVGKLWLEFTFAPRDITDEEVGAALVLALRGQPDGEETLEGLRESLGVAAPLPTVSIGWSGGRPNLLIYVLMLLMTAAVTMFAHDAIVRGYRAVKKIVAPRPAPSVPTPRQRTPPPPAPARTLSFTGLGGDVQTVLAVGNHAVVAAGAGGLKIVKVGETSLTLVGEFTQHLVRDVAVSHGVAFAASGTNGVLVLDISDPARIRELTRLPTLEGTLASGVRVGGSAHSVTVRERLLFVAEASGTSIYDITKADAPVRLSTILEENGLVWDVAANDKTAVLALRARNGFGAGVQTLDISDPRQTSPLASITTVPDADQVVLNGDIAYVANSRDGLLVVDISSPLSPSTLDQWRDASVFDVTLTDDGLLARTEKGIATFDVSDPRVVKFRGYLKNVQAAAVLIGSRMCGIVGDRFDCTIQSESGAPPAIESSPSSK